MREQKWKDIEKGRKWKSRGEWKSHRENVNVGAKGVRKGDSKGWGGENK